MRLPERDVNPRNAHKVRRKVWDSWTVVARHVFNKVYETSISDSDMMRHPKDVESQAVLDEYWKTIAWNHAFIAATVCTRGEKHLIEVLVKEIKDGDHP